MSGTRRGDCARCEGKNKSIKARRLCESCYAKERAAGTLDNWPTLRRTKFVGYCQCFQPIRERFGLYDITQCKRCGKKVL